MKPTVLCYNLKGTKKGKKITMIFGFLGYKIRHVSAEEYLVTLGALAGGESGREEEIYEGEGFSEEMLVIHTEQEELLDQALFLMRKEKVQVDLKAVLTQSNQEWNSLALYEEIKKEHEMMKKREEERKQ